jgi:type II secretory ATPase GspE/PulE/Tfp pilus assembly ATPase PilB-like protein
MASASFNLKAGFGFASWANAGSENANSVKCRGTRQEFRFTGKPKVLTTSATKRRVIFLGTLCSIMFLMIAWSPSLDTVSASPIGIQGHPSISLTASATSPTILIAAQQKKVANKSDGPKLNPGGFLSYLKLGLIAATYLLWVLMADWVNRDALQIGQKSKMAPELWNPIIVLSFLLGLIVVLAVPIFWIGWPVFLLTAFVPPLIYIFVRGSRIKNDKAIASAARNKGKDRTTSFDMEEELLPQDQGEMVDISPVGGDSTEKKARLIRGRQGDGYPTLKNVIHASQVKRGEQLMIDCHKNGAAIRVFVDGIWHPIDPIAERPEADALATSLKHLAGMDPADRRNKQTGRFDAKTVFGKHKVNITSQGVQTGERILLRFEGAKKGIMELDELGMFPEMIEAMRQSMNNPGLTIISAPPSHGLTSAWQGAIASSARLTRDCVGFYKPSETESTIENIVPKPYDPADGQTSLAALKAVLLSQPDALIVPEVDDAETMDLLVDQALQHERAIFFRTPANSAAEALIRMYAKSGNRAAFLDAVKSTSCQRLLRRLCPECRVEVRVQPQMIQKLGGNPKKQGTVFNPYKLPPPEQRVDEKGNPIEFPPCTTCGGIGYIGRVAAFELLTMSDQLKTVIKQKPDVATVEAASIKLGKKPLVNQAYQLVLLGVTSLAEVQRVFNPPKKK